MDGWRAISILMVLASHSEELPGFSGQKLASLFPLAFDGNLGVRFFFVISGFLITYLLIQEHDRLGEISLRNFYARRALRILPVYLLYLAVVACLQFFTKLHQAPITWIGDLTFTTNFLPRGPISGHLWSLAVEEQFYLIWPVTFIWLGGHKKLAPWVFATPILLAILCRMVKQAGLVPWVLHPLFHMHSSLVNFDSLDVGCMLAFLLARHRQTAMAWLSGGKKYAAMILGFLLVALPTMNLPGLLPLLIPTGPLLQAAGFGTLLLTSVLHPGSFKPLNWPLIAQVGILSYSIYIWQQIFSIGPQSYGLSNVWWLSFPGWLLLAFLAGVTSYYGLERPLLKLRARFRRF